MSLPCHRNNIINAKIYERNIPSKPLQPYLDARPVMTKYSLMPIVDPRKITLVKMNQMASYNTSTTFNPGTAVAPWSGYSSNVNTESELRNQIFALQKCDQSVYVPTSASDLYKYKYTPPEPFLQNTQHSLLFNKEAFCEFNPTPQNIHSTIFNNYTRNQIKDLTVETK